MSCYALVEAEEKTSFLGYGDSTKIRDEFKSEAQKLMLDLKQNHRVKEINGKPMTGYMLLNLALEYVDALNNSAPIAILKSFEKVINIECDRYTEALFEKIKARTDTVYSVAKMPFEKSELQSGRRLILTYAFSKLSEKLAQILDTTSLV